MPQLQDVINYVVEFFKLIGPVLLFLLFMYGILWYFVDDIYKFNVQNKITNAFPSQGQINSLFYASLAGMSVIFFTALFQVHATKEEQKSSQNQNIPA